MSHIRKTVVGATVGLSLLVASCGASGNGQDSAPPTTPGPQVSANGYTLDSMGIFYLKLADGYNLLCIYASGAYRQGGPSCNWPGYEDWLNAKK